MRLLIFCALFFVSFQGHGKSYSVIVNVENGFKGDPKAYYTLEKNQWPSGEEVAPVGIKVEGSLEKGVILAGFIRSILKFGGISEYREYWIRQKSKGLTRRPIDKTSFKAILRLVSREKGGIGYVPTELAKSNGSVKIISSFNP